MPNRFSRTKLIYGENAMNELSTKRVAVFGIGGVGGFAAEALVRSGIGAIDIIDNDTVCITNLNRQIYATEKTVGMDKVDAAEERIKEINPNCVVTKHKVFYTPDTAHLFNFKDYDYIVDAIDTVSGKLALAENAKLSNTPIISSMGAGNKVNPAAFEVSDIFKTSVCPLAKVMRSLLKKRGIKKLKVVYSKELPLTPLEDASGEENLVSTQSNRRQTPGSTAFVPPVVGLIIAGEVINDLTGFQGAGIGV